MSSTALQTESSTIAEIGHLGLIAGGGEFPLLVARAARSRMLSVTAVGIEGVTSPKLEDEVNTMRWIKFGQFNNLVRALRTAGVTKAVMVGRVKHNAIFQLKNIDLRGLRLIGKLANRKADSILGLAVEEFANENIEILDSTLFLRDSMPGKGLLTPSVPATEEILGDIEFGIEHARKIAGLDIGQTVIVKSRSIVAVEAMEGTDAAIHRAGEVAGPDCVVCKVSKPQQDRRFDFPVFGLTTIKKMIGSGAAAFAFPGEEVLFFDQEEAIPLAEANKICIIGV